MSELTCVEAREAIPDLASGRPDRASVSELEAHLATCSACSAELELVHALWASRARVPSHIAERVIEAVSRDRRRPARPGWGLTAAAVAALALGIGIASDPAPVPAPDVPGYAYEVEEGTVWASEDGLVAGGPLLDDLSDEALEQLLEELSVSSSGGAA